MTKVEINQEVIDWIVDQVDLNEVSEKTKTNLLAWQKGEKKPTVKQIRDASKSSGVPYAYFFLKEPFDVTPDLIEFRTVDSIELKRPSRNLINTINDMKMIQDFMRDYYIREGFTPLSFVGAYDINEEPLKLASELRAFLELDEEWYLKVKNGKSYKFIKEQISDSGILVMQNGIVANNTRQKLKTAEFRAFALVDEYAPLIFINTNDAYNAKVFSLLHETVHILLGENSLYNQNEDKIQSAKVNKIETLCNAVTAELMVPNDIFCRKWQTDENASRKKIQNYSKYFKASKTVIARRALDNKFIDYEFYKIISEEAKSDYILALKEKEKEKAGGGNFYNSKISKYDKRFLAALAADVAGGNTTYTEAFRLSKTNANTFRNILEKAGLS